MFEFENFKKGTVALMDAVVAATQRGATTIIGMGKKIILNNLICKMSKALLQYGPENVQKLSFKVEVIRQHVQPSLEQKTKSAMFLQEVELV